MKRNFSADEQKSAANSVGTKLDAVKANMSESDASALSQMLEIANKHLQELSKDHLAIAQAGVAQKPKSVHAR